MVTIFWEHQKIISSTCS